MLLDTFFNNRISANAYRTVAPQNSARFRSIFSNIPCIHFPIVSERYWDRPRVPSKWGECLFWWDENYRRLALEGLPEFEGRQTGLFLKDLIKRLRVFEPKLVRHLGHRQLVGHQV